MKRLTLTLAALLFCACRNEPPPSPPKGRPEVLVDKTPPLPEGHPDLPALKVASRSVRRLSVEQIERSLDVIGNLPPGTVRLPDNLALTLGQPDYDQVTEESLDTSPLFMKFMLDLGGIACTNLSDAEPNRPVADRLMTRFSTVDENLRHMLLRFTSIEGDAAKPYLERLKATYEAGARSTTRPRGGYEAVCIALFTSPEFLLY